MQIDVTPPPMPSDFPAISVIIPMYNAEKYIGELLDSLLAQTLQDFEVIVVDDCSTDNSAAVVESYIPKFNGRLILNKFETNSGGEGKPRNVGLTLAHGEYIFFVDSDDFILTTALETLYNAAKENEADVVYTSSYYDLRNPNDVYLIKDGLALSLLKEGLEDKTDLIVDDPNKLLRLLLIENPPAGNHRTAWTKFIQRKFLIENNIDFPNIPVSPDFIWVINVYCHAKRFLRISTPLYFYRNYNETFITQTQKKPSEQISRWISGFVDWVKCFGELQRKNKILSENLTYSFTALRGHFGSVLSCIKETCGQLGDKEIYEILYNKFSQEDNLKDLTVPFFFSLINDDSKIKTEQSNVIDTQKKSVQESARLLAEKEEEIQQLKAQIALMPYQSMIPTARSNCPAISVIIPMYNVEKYVAECLDSLLAQTFQNFEVIVVDDCSTDKSVDVVESYMSKFDGRLTLAKTKTNSGGAGIPRNRGIELACGEYLSFIDPDDTITPTAFEELYSEAKKVNADVVHCEKWYQIPDEFYHDDEYRKNLKPMSWPTLEEIFVTQPTLLTINIKERVVDFCERRWLTWSVCLQFVRRDFILENKIRFTNIHAEDLLFTLHELCCAKRYIIVPNVFYFYRLRKGSAILEDFDVSKLIHKYSSTLKLAISYLDEFLDRHEIFSNRADLKYVLFNFFEAEVMPRLDKVYHATSSYALDELLRREFGDNALTAFLFNTMNDYRLKLAQSQNRVTVLENSLKNFVGKAIPAVSVIIPVFNAEKYIGELLDSLLAQTFQNFEVIVVDDCSTDNSRAVVVESYAPKFKNGQLLLSITKKNTGSPGDPSNLGVNLSRGEYLLILDHDDAITPDALEKLYISAKTFNADVVTCEYFYLVPEKSWNDAEFRKNLKPHSYKEGDFVSEPTLVPFDVAERVRSCYEREFLWPLWSKFIRREFLIESKIRFTNNIIQDFLATCCMIYTAKRFLRVPHVVNLWRMRDASLSNKKREPLKKFQKYLRALTVGIEYLNDFLNKIEFFQQNPEQRNIALKTYAREVMKYYIQGIYKDVPLAERYETLRKEFAGGENAALTEICFNTVADSANNVEINKANSEIVDKFKSYFTARIDIQRRVKAGDFQIVSISDDKANVWKPDWFQKDGIGYQIQSYTGKVEFVAKSTADGQIKLELRGLDIRDSKDKSKRIPYWIDYTNLTVNGKKIFDKLTPAWHDKPYIYKMDVKANEEIKIQTEWLPHRIDVLPPPPPPKEKPIDGKFLPYLTARADIKLVPKTADCDLKIVSVSDNKAAVLKPDWLQKGGIGYQIQSYNGTMEIVAKVTGEGQVKLWLLGLDIRDPKDKSKRIPYWIDYTKLTVNGEVILDKLTPVWHDKPYIYNMDAKTDNEIKIKIEWLPHRSDT